MSFRREAPAGAVVSSSSKGFADVALVPDSRVNEIALTFNIGRAQSVCAEHVAAIRCGEYSGIDV